MTPSSRSSTGRSTGALQLVGWLGLSLLVLALLLYGLIAEGIVDWPGESRAQATTIDPELVLARSLLVPPARTVFTGDQLTREPALLIRAGSLIERALERSPEDPQAYALRSLLHLAEGDLERAEADIRRSLSLGGDPTGDDTAATAERLILWGTIQSRRGDYDGAEASFRQVTELEPSNYLAWHNLGQTLHLLGREEESLEAYRRKLEERGEPRR